MLKCDLTKNMDRMTLELKLKVMSGQLLTIFGPSGAGKSTLLNIIAGITQADRGLITLNDVVLLDKEGHHSRVNMPIHKRHIGYIQQKCCLFPHMSIKENILYSVDKKAWHSAQAYYKDLLDILAIGHLVKTPISSLSGGEQQRVALARTLLMKPSLLLLDEPFSALDFQIRSGLWKMVEEVKVRYSIPMIFVTHDIHEAKALSDTIAILREGSILQVDTPSIIMERPISEEVAAIVAGNKEAS